MTRWYYTIAFALAFTVGYFSPKKVDRLNVVEFASELPVEDTYQNLECPTPTEMRALLDSIRFEYTEKDLSCDDFLFSRLTKTLKFAKSLRFEFPKNWPQDIGSEAANLLQYLANNSNKVSFDLTQATSFAYNRVSAKEIYLGARALELSPLDLLSVLFHEARHSSPKDPGHLACLKGDLPNYPGACDAYFTLDSSIAGSYSYSVLYFLSTALYLKNATEGQKKWALQKGLHLLATRFNELDHSLASFNDILALIDHSNRVFLYNLHNGLLSEFEYPKSDDEKVMRIDFSTATGGLLFYTTKGQLYTWSFYDKSNSLVPFMESQIKESGIFPLLTDRVYVPFEEGTHYMIYGNGNKLKVNYYDTEDRKFKLRDFKGPIHANHPQPIPSLKIFFQALNIENIMIDQSGRLYTAPRYGSDPPFVEPKVLNQEVWSGGTGGVYGDSLYLINDQGQVRSFLVDYDDPNSFEGDELDPHSLRRIRPDKSPPEFPEKVLQYVQGIDYEAILTQNHQVTIRKKDNPQQSNTLFLPNLKKILVLRQVETTLAP